MIRITVYRRGSTYTGISAKGHAAYAEEGSDIICAAASALLTNAVNSIECLAGDRIEDLESESGLVACRFPDGLHEKGMLLMESLILGLKQLEEIRGPEDEPYVRLLIEEERS